MKQQESGERKLWQQRHVTGMRPAALPRHAAASEAKRAQVAAATTFDGDYKGAQGSMKWSMKWSD